MPRRRDLISSLRRVYDTNLESIASLSLRAARQEPRPDPVPPRPNRVAVIYGVRTLVEGPTRTPGRLNTDSVTFRRNNVNTVDIWDLDTYGDQAIYGRTPLLFRRGDDIQVYPHPRRADEPAGTDNLVFLGRVVEALGQTVTGEERPRIVARAKSKNPERIARRLLLGYLNSEEKESWQKKHQILIPSQVRPGFTYEITPKLVYLLNEKGLRIESYCLVPTEPVPSSDVVLSKYILLKGNEQKFLSIANRQVLYHPEAPQPTARTRLEARRETIDVGRIGLQGGTYQGLIPIDIRSLENAVTQYGIASALLDGIATDEGGLVIRDIRDDDLQINNNPNNRRRRN